MIYKEFQDIELSALGFGAMRLPTTAGDPNGSIDEKQTAEMVAYAIEHGINYFDTAYGLSLIHIYLRFVSAQPFRSVPCPHSGYGTSG